MRRFRDTGKPVSSFTGFSQWDVGWVHNWNGTTIYDPVRKEWVLCIEMEPYEDGFPESTGSRRSNQAARV